MCNVVFHTYLIKFHQNVIYLIKTHYSINLKHYSRHLTRMLSFLVGILRVVSRVALGGGVIILV
jgi:hypothetical protein